MIQRLIFIAGFFIWYACTDIIEKNISDDVVTLLAPSDSVLVTNSQVTFLWDPLRGARSYRIQVAHPDFATISSILVDSTISGTSFTLDLPSGNYQWRIAGTNQAYTSKWSTRTIQIDSSEVLTGKKVSILTPTDGSYTNNASVLLSWNPLIGAILYRIQIDSGSTPIYETTTTSTQLTLDFEDGSYITRVRAENTTTISSYSQNVLFYVKTTIPATPIPISPLDNATIGQESILTWSSTGGVYDSIYVYSDVLLTTTVAKGKSNTKSFDLPILANGIYYWQVFTFDVAGNKSNGSSLFRFNL